MPLNGYKSLCQEQQAIIVSSEQGRQHRAINSDRCFVTHYQIDGAVIRTGLRCDYLLINEDKSDAYLIELKGTDIVHAVDQLEATAQTPKTCTTELSYKIPSCTHKSQNPCSHGNKIQKVLSTPW